MRTKFQKVLRKKKKKKIPKFLFLFWKNNLFEKIFFFQHASSQSSPTCVPQQTEASLIENWL